MELSEAARRKCSPRLREKLATTPAPQLLEIVVRAKDPEALERPTHIPGADPSKRIEAEQQHGTHILEDLAEYIRRLGQQGLETKLIDKSWLTHSILVSAVTESISRIAARDDVESVDLNSEIHLQE